MEHKNFKPHTHHGVASKSLIKVIVPAGSDVIEAYIKVSSVISVYAANVVDPTTKKPTGEVEYFALTSAQTPQGPSTYKISKVDYLNFLAYNGATLEDGTPAITEAKVAAAPAAAPTPDGK